MKKNNLVYINHILTYTEEALKITHNITIDEFYNDRRNELSVIRCFEVMGEAAKRIDPSFKEKYPDIDWREMAAFRDVLIHDYEGLILEIIFDTATKILPVLKHQLLIILENEGKQ